MSQQSQPATASLINHRARLIQDISLKGGGKTHFLSKDSLYIVTDRDPGNPGHLWLVSPVVGQSFTTTIAYRLPSDQVEVLSERYWNDNNCAGRMVQPGGNIMPQGPDGFRFEAGRDGQILGMTQDQTRFIVKVPYGDNVGKTFQLPVRHARIKSNFPGGQEMDYVHRRFKFVMDYTCHDGNGRFVHKFKKDDDQSCIRDVADGGRTLILTTPAVDNGRQHLRVDFWAGNFNKSLLDADFVDHTFRARRDTNCTVEPSDVLKKGMVGRIKGVKKDKTEFHVKLFTGPDFWVPINNIDVGPPLGDYRISLVSSSASGALRPTIPANKPQTGDLIDRLLGEILTELYTTRDNTPQALRRYDIFMRNPSAIAQTIGVFKRGMHPNAFQAMNRDRCISLGTIRSLPDVTNSGKKGVYIRVYEDFPTKSPYHDMIFIYVGQTTVGFMIRGQSHKTRTKSPTTGSRHYAVAKAARKLTYRGIFNIDEQMSHDNVNLIECLFMMILNTFSPRIKVTPTGDQWKIDTTGPTFNYWANAYVATLLTQITDAACKHTGFKYPDGGKKDLEGLNLNLPLLEVSWNTKHRWVRHTLGDRWIFTTNSYTFEDQGKSDASKQFTFWIHSGNDEKHSILVKPDEKHGLDVGKKFWASLEVMKEGVHEAPFYRLPTIGSLNNWNIGSRIGIKVTWEHKGKYYAKYIQQVSTTSVLDSAQLAHKQGAGLYAYIMQGRWPESADRPQSYSSTPHIAEVLDLAVDHFRQECALDLKPAPLKPLPVIQRNLEVAANLMRRLDLENVNHTWQGLGHVDLDAELRAKDTNMQTAKKYIRDRYDCDYCFMGCVVSHPVWKWLKNY